MYRSRKASVCYGSVASRKERPTFPLECVLSKVLLFKMDQNRTFLQPYPFIKHDNFIIRRYMK